MQDNPRQESASTSGGNPHESPNVSRGTDAAERPPGSGKGEVEAPSFKPLVTDKGGVDVSGMPPVDASGLPASRVIGHEEYEVGLRGIFQFFAWFAGVLAVTGVVVYFLVNAFQAGEVATERPKSALASEVALPPEPRLQPSRGHESLDEADMARLRAEYDKALTSYGWTDEKAGVARIPIDVAMRRAGDESSKMLPFKAGGKRPEAEGKNR